MAVQENQSELDLLFLAWLRTGFVVLEAGRGRKKGIKGTSIGTTGAQSHLHFLNC